MVNLHFPTVSLPQRPSHALSLNDWILSSFLIIASVGLTVFCFVFHIVSCYQCFGELRLILKAVIYLAEWGLQAYCYFLVLSCLVFNSSSIPEVAAKRAILLHLLLAVSRLNNWSSDHEWWFSTVKCYGYRIKQKSKKPGVTFML